MQNIEDVNFYYKVNTQVGEIFCRLTNSREMRTKDLHNINCIKSEANKVSVKHKKLTKIVKYCNKIFSDNKTGAIGRQQKIVGL